MKKRFLVLPALVLMMAFTLGGCGGDDTWVDGLVNNNNNNCGRDFVDCNLDSKALYSGFFTDAMNSCAEAGKTQPGHAGSNHASEAYGAYSTAVDNAWRDRGEPNHDGAPCITEEDHNKARSETEWMLCN